jgi:hypothetical protein
MNSNAACRGAKNKAYSVLLKKPKRKRPLGRPSGTGAYSATATRGSTRLLAEHKPTALHPTTKRSTSPNVTQFRRVSCCESCGNTSRIVHSTFFVRPSHVRHAHKPLAHLVKQTKSHSLGLRAPASNCSPLLITANFTR